MSHIRCAPFLPIGELSYTTPGTNDNWTSDKSGGGVPFGTSSF